MNEIEQTLPIPSILRQIEFGMSQDDVKKLFSTIITKGEREILGDDAEDMMIMALAASIPFSFGGDFDSEAFAAVVDNDLAEHLSESEDYAKTFDENIDPDRINALLNIAKRAGFISINEKGRLYFEPEFSEIIDVFFADEL